MDPKIITAVLAAGAVIVGAILGRPRAVPNPLDRLAKLVDIQAKLSDGSQRDALLKLVDAQIEDIAKKSSESSVARRNWYGVFWSVVFAAAGLALGWVFVSLGGWWMLGLVVPGILVLAGVVSFGQNVTKVPRASNGQTIAYQERMAAKRAT